MKSSKNLQKPKPKEADYKSQFSDDSSWTTLSDWILWVSDKFDSWRDFLIPDDWWDYPVLD